MFIVLGMLAANVHALDIKLHEVNGGDDWDRVTLRHVLKTMKTVLNYPTFENEILNYPHFEGTNGLTNAEILKSIKRGHELFDDVEDRDGVMDLRINIVHRMFMGRTAAYTTGYSPFIYVRAKTVRKQPFWELAGILTHEWVHLLGFDHATDETYDSVPYAVGKIMETMSKGIFIQNEHH